MWVSTWAVTSTSHAQCTPLQRYAASAARLPLLRAPASPVREGSKPAPALASRTPWFLYQCVRCGSLEVESWGGCEERATIAHDTHISRTSRLTLGLYPDHRWYAVWGTGFENLIFQTFMYFLAALVSFLCRFPLVTASRGCSVSRCVGFSLWWLLSLPHICI